MAYNKKAHLRDNIEAIRLMFRLEKEQRTRHTGGSGHTRRLLRVRGIKAVLSLSGNFTDILRWTQADRELFPDYGTSTSCVTEQLTSVSTGGWWKA